MKWTGVKYGSSHYGNQFQNKLDQRKREIKFKSCWNKRKGKSSSSQVGTSHKENQVQVKVEQAIREIKFKSSSNKWKGKSSSSPVSSLRQDKFSLWLWRKQFCTVKSYGWKEPALDGKNQFHEDCISTLLLPLLYNKFCLIFNARSTKVFGHWTPTAIIPWGTLLVKLCVLLVEAKTMCLHLVLHSIFL